LNHQVTVSPSLRMTGKGLLRKKKCALAGIYIHIPFCLKKCPYCNFFSTTDLSLKEKFINALFREIEIHQGLPLLFDTIYFGGGTPSLLSPEETFSILSKLFKHFKIQQDAEITMEINPGTAGAKIFHGYMDAGINRLNIGVQSFQNKHLKFLGRIHSAEDACVALISARNAGFSNIGIDLIYGLSDQSLKDWKNDLQKALSFHPEHLSCYMLTYERKTPFYKAKEKGHIIPPSEVLSGNLFSFTWDFLSAHSYIPYEISNFSRIDSKIEELYRSRHNQKYWTFAPYIGLGPSAHSYLDPVRFWNLESVDQYIRTIQSGNSPMAGKETLTMEQQMIESVFLGLRTKEGIDLKRFEKKFGHVFSKIFSIPLKNLAEKDYLILSDNFCKLTPSGMRFHDSICDLLIGAMP
jgi:oxygen-independent coproporphyrinogen III oxidase